MIISSGYILRFIFTPIFTPIFTSGNYPLLPFFNYQIGMKTNGLLMILKHVFMTNNEDLILNIIVLCALCGVGTPVVTLISGRY